MWYIVLKCASRAIFKNKTNEAARQIHAVHLERPCSSCSGFNLMQGSVSSIIIIIIIKFLGGLHQSYTEYVYGTYFSPRRRIRMGLAVLFTSSSKRILRPCGSDLVFDMENGKNRD